jgi:hypothetical protein
MATIANLGSPNRLAGLDLTATGLVPATSGGDAFAPGPSVYLRVKTTGTACVPTVMNAGANAGPNGTFLAPIALTGPGATGDRLYGPFPASTFADPSDGLVHVAYSAVTGVSVGVYTIH